MGNKIAIVENIHDYSIVMCSFESDTDSATRWRFMAKGVSGPQIRDQSTYIIEKET